MRQPVAENLKKNENIDKNINLKIDIHKTHDFLFFIICNK